MNNVYEQFETAKPGILYKVSRIGMWVCNISATFYLLLFNTLFALVCALGSLLFILYKKEAYVEFEYKFNSGEITIVKITDKKKRRTIVKFTMSQIEAMFPENDANLARFKDYTAIGKDCFTDKEKRIYDILSVQGGERILLRFTPNDEFISCCYRSNPKAVTK